MLLNNLFIDFHSFTFYLSRLFNAKITIYRFSYNRREVVKDFDISVNFTLFGLIIVIRKRFITNVIIIIFIKVRTIRKFEY